MKILDRRVKAFTRSDIDAQVAAATDAAMHRLSRTELQQMLAAAQEVEECYRVMRKGGLNIVGEILRGQAEFVELDHYPDDDVFDPDTHAQYYYHAHRGLDGEHGHFHTFLRQPGMAQGVRPIEYAASDPWPQGDDALSHLVCISMDAYGYPIGLFTTNRWVTAEAWYRAADVIGMLERFRIDHAAPSWPVNRWISAMFVLFRPQMAALLQVRDEVVDQWQSQVAPADVFEDRKLDVTSRLPISVDAQVRRVRGLLTQSAA